MLPDCAIEIADYYQVPMEVIEAIATIESGGRSGVVATNSNGSRDLGIMQINTWWWDPHDHNLHTLHISKEEVLHNPCTNIAVGSWIVRLNLQTWGNWPDAIAAYNTGDPVTGRAYAERVFAEIERIGWPEQWQGPVAADGFAHID